MTLKATYVSYCFAADHPPTPASGGEGCFFYSRSFVDELKGHGPWYVVPITNFCFCRDRFCRGDAEPALL